MKTFLITYQLNTDNDYTPFYEALKSFPKWWHYLKSTWLIQTESATAKLVYNTLATHIYKADLLLIIEVTNNYHGWLPKGAWDWMSKNI